MANAEHNGKLGKENGANLGRRRMLAITAGVLATGATLTGSTSAYAAKPDPIYAAIEHHRAAWDAFATMIKTAISDDDPRIEIASDEEEEAAIAILGVTPLTIPGVIALLKHAAEHEKSGNTWPCGLSDSEDEGDRFGARYGHSWSYFLHRDLAKALASITEGQ